MSKHSKINQWMSGSKWWVPPSHHCEPHTPFWWRNPQINPMFLLSSGSNLKTREYYRTNKTPWSPHCHQTCLHHSTITIASTNTTPLCSHVYLLTSTEKKFHRRISLHQTLHLSNKAVLHPRIAWLKHRYSLPLIPSTLTAYTATTYSIFKELSA